MYNRTYLREQCDHVTWAYSISPIMESFRELIKHNATFKWNEMLNQLFHQSALTELLISKVEEDINAFDIKGQMCLQND